MHRLWLPFDVIAVSKLFGHPFGRSSVVQAPGKESEIDNDVVEKWDIFGSDRERAGMYDPYLEVGLREFENACIKASTQLTSSWRFGLPPGQLGLSFLAFPSVPFNLRAMVGFQELSQDQLSHCV